MLPNCNTVIFDVRKIYKTHNMKLKCYQFFKKGYLDKNNSFKS